MSLKLNSSGGGSVTLQEPATASNFTLNLPAGTGTAVVNGVSSAIVSGTAVSATGTAIDFTGIPSWVKRITFMIAGVSTNGSSKYGIQLGTSSGFQTSGYSGAVSRESTVGSDNFSSLFQMSGGIASSTIIQGNMTITNLSGNTWTEVSQVGYSDGAATAQGAGFVTLSGTLTRIRFTTLNGTDAFDAGTINILYE